VAGARSRGEPARLRQGRAGLPLVAAGCATTASAANQAAGRAVLDDVLSVAKIMGGNMRRLLEATLG
jgi:hypothetical protein